MHTAVGALKLLVCCPDVPVKSISALRSAGVDADRHPDPGAVVQRQRERAVLQPRDHPAHRFLGVVLHMPHVGLHHVQAELLDHLAQFLHAFFVGRDLGFQVGHVLLGVAARVGATSEQGKHLGFSRSVPRSTSLKLSICTPSSSITVEKGGIEPGVCRRCPRGGLSNPRRTWDACPHPRPLPEGEGAYARLTPALSRREREFIHIELPLPLAGEGWGEGCR